MWFGRDGWWRWGLVVLLIAGGCSDAPDRGEPGFSEAGGTSKVAIVQGAEGPTETQSEVIFEGIVTPANIMEAEAYWPNIVSLDAAWQPPDTKLKRPRTLQGTLIRVEPDGRVRVDLGRFGRVEVLLSQTDLIERANRVRDGSLFKHGGNLTLQISPLLVRSDLDRPGPNPSREIKSADRLLIVYADPRDTSFPELARRLADWSADFVSPIVLVPQNVSREDLDYLRVRLQRTGWRVPYVYPERAAVQTERLLREAPSGPWLQLLTRDGRELTSASLEEPDLLDQLGG